MQRGVPAEAIRSIHEAKNDAEKARLFAAARAGRIAVLIGSTEKMGVGTNVQARAIALYHLDCPWRPSDIAQREGRILRQGNQNPEVAIVRFVTERSFDAYMWQGVERKATFIAQIMRGRLDTREVDELDTTTLSAAEAKAISSGNPLLLELSTAQAELGRLRRLQRAHERNEAMLTHTRDTARADLARAEHDIHGLEAAVPRVTDLSGDRFNIEIDGRRLTTRSDAAQALAAWTARVGIRWLPRHASRDFGTIGRISSFPITVQARPGVNGLEIGIRLADVPRSNIHMGHETFLAGGIGLVQRIENRVSGTASLLAQARADHERSAALVQESADRAAVVFRHATALMETERSVTRLERLLRKASPSQNAPSDGVPLRQQSPQARIPPATRAPLVREPSWPARN